MATIERTAYPTTSARQARAKRNYLRGLQGYPVRPAAAGPSATKDRFWLLWVAMLSVPSLVFLLLYVFFVPADLPKFFDVGLVAAFAVSGTFGASTAFAAFVVTMIGSLRGRIARMTRIALWTLVALTLGCWLYVWISFAVLVQVAPVIPLKM